MDWTVQGPQLVARSANHDFILLAGHRQRQTSVKPPMSEVLGKRNPVPVIHLVTLQMSPKSSTHGASSHSSLLQPVC